MNWVLELIGDLGAVCYGYGQIEDEDEDGHPLDFDISDSEFIGVDGGKASPIPVDS